MSRQGTSRRADEQTSRQANKGRADKQTRDKQLANWCHLTRYLFAHTYHPLFARLLVCSFAGLLVCWSARLLVCLFARLLVCSSARLLVCSSARLLVPCLLIEKTSFVFCHSALFSAQRPPRAFFFRIFVAIRACPLTARPPGMKTYPDITLQPQL